ncbi:M20/M25/M40 family metallo-hydrolase [Frigoriflavimonas asaccharolytica]|uniref:Carboxypeptidase Q n=1 Tax=Frigoriflavimonas asaccharolytica TaxID=2735899 RepID=A0A8J8GC71_9FLAO|nr:M20/M25/M40 family metallo-hydrolase [Frigoriflavimonas asaccharolytica]NRS93037.1 Zn-dependent M28 family amino/carboxypeptidase [Frigoriflavimonas asaccharolytica]
MTKLFTIIPLFLGGILFSQKTISDADMFKTISTEILLNSKVYEDLRELTKDVGPRFSATPGYAKATDWAEKKMKQYGAQNIYKQEVVVPVWKRGRESLQIKTEKGNYKNIRMLALGGSEGTNGKDLTGEILFVKDLTEFNKLFSNDVKDKIVFFNFAFDQSIVNPADAYNIAGKYRWTTPSLVSRKGAKAVITRSATSAFDDVPHTGSMYYDKDELNKVPAITIGAKSADELEQLLKTQKVFAKINTTSGTKGTAINHNVIGEIPGTLDKSVILIGAHLDSWDISEGAHDNGAGVVHCLEVLRAFKAMGYKNKHTIRVVLFANEENGVHGGEKYAEEVKKKGEKHLFAIESDAGGFAPRGISLDMVAQRRRLIFAFKDLFLPYGVYNFDEEYAGQDIVPLKKLGVPLAELVPDMQRYFDIHHTSEDTFDKVNRRELMLGAVSIAQIVYMIDQRW